MISFFKTIVYIPLYNLFILILNINWIDAGLATVILTILVKIILYPLSKKSSIAQLKMKEKEGEIAEIRAKYKNSQEQAVKLMEFYKVNNINPFSGILPILIQIPVIFSLYYIFFSGLPTVDVNILYSFVKAPESIKMTFLGLIDVSQKSLLLALLAAISTFFQAQFAITSLGDQKGSSGKDDFAKMMTKQMKYFMPVMVFFISWKISGVVALYWFVSNITSIIQDIYIKKVISKKETNFISRSMN